MADIGANMAAASQRMPVPPLVPVAVTTPNGDLSTSASPRQRPHLTDNLSYAASPRETGAKYPQFDNVMDHVNNRLLRAPGEPYSQPTLDNSISNRHIFSSNSFLARDGLPKSPVQQRDVPRLMNGNDQATPYNLNGSTPSSESSENDGFVAASPASPRHGVIPIADGDESCDGNPEKCGECGQEFTDMQRYWSHQCSRAAEEGRVDEQDEDAALLEQRQEEPMEGRERDEVEDEVLTDVESFDGKIVYNPDGSAYIIEGESDLSDAETMLELPKQEGSIVDQKGKLSTSQVPAFPQIASAYYIQRNPNPYYNAFYMFPSDNKPPVEAPIMISYRVYDLRSNKKEDDEADTSTSSTAAKLLKSFPKLHRDALTVPTKPILMCFICKLSFGYAKSFVAHATGEHSMTLNEDERSLLARKNASAIIQGVGRDKDPLMSFLEPTLPPATKVTNSSSSTDNSGQVKPYSNSVFQQYCGSNTNVSYVYANTKVTPMEQGSSSDSMDGSDCEESARSGGVVQPDDGARWARHNSALPPSRERQSHTQHHHDKSLAGLDSTALNLSHVPSSLYDGGDRMLTESPSQLPLSRNISSPSAGKDGSPAADSGRMPLSPSSAMSHGIVIRGGCDEHPQGNISGVECPKCDAVLGSTRSLGGHMTMMHSRNSCKTLKCPKCNWHYKYQETLEIHMKEKHPENETSCVYCLTNQSHPRLSRGEVYTCGYKPYRCEVCNYSTTTKGNLSIHMQSDKHINNMQDLQNGTASGEMKIQVPTPASSVASQPPPPSPVPVLQGSQSDLKKASRPKPTWRCDVCNYETNVARNLRIHMTSEKHSHNMMVLQQNVKHMQRDMQFQINQMALLGQDPTLAMMSMQPPTPPGMPPFGFDQSMFVTPLPSTLENPMDLTKQEGMGDMSVAASSVALPMDIKNNNNEANKIFQCFVCNAYSTDSLEALHQHQQLDRSKQNDHDNITVVSGTYLCNLCTYKTNLKANFQLHCKTDKHLQKLQLVNHIREGGPANEWRLKYMNVSNPVQVRCNACDYYTNSIHKLQLHTTNPRHEANAKLFQYLQNAEAQLGPAKSKYYHCDLCNFATKARLNLIQHVRSMKHMRSEGLRMMKLSEQGQDVNDLCATDLAVFTVREYSDTEPVKFDENDGDAEGLPLAGEDPPSSDVHLPRDAHKTAAVVTVSPGGKGVGHASSSGGSSSGSRTSLTTRPCSLCSYSCASDTQLQTHLATVHGQVGTDRLTKSLVCPLCQEKTQEKAQLEYHLVKVHNVKSEGLHKLLGLVSGGQPASSPSAPPQTSQASPALKAAAGQEEGFDQSEALLSPQHDKHEAMEVEADLNDAEILETRALKLAQEASLDGVVLADKDTEENFRCQTCAKIFLDIDGLYAHQNELGHLELKQTPRGPGYLCWKKGCNQYFKTASALQVHFREIHAKKQQVAVSERHVYKFRCNQCSLAFKTLDKLQLHSYYHIIRAASNCCVCGRSFRSIAAMKKHVENTHMDTITASQLDEFNAAVATMAPLGLLAKDENSPPSPVADSIRMLEDESNDGRVMGDEEEESSEGSTSYNKEQFMEDYINSQAIAENSYSDPSRKYKCHRCKVAFTKQNYLSAHNKTLMHRKGDKISYPMEKYLDPNRPYKCDVCKESFTQKNILLVHYNSVSHLHKLKQLTTQQDMEAASSFSPSSVPLTTSSHPSMTSTSAASGSSPTPPVLPSQTQPVLPDSDKKPYKCNICKVSYSQSSTLDIHIRSVLHQTRTAKVQELALAGQIDITQPLIEQPSDGSKTSGHEQQKKMLSDVMQQQQLKYPSAASADPPVSVPHQPPMMYGAMPPLPPLVPMHSAGAAAAAAAAAATATATAHQQAIRYLGERQSSTSAKMSDESVSPSPTAASTPQPLDKSAAETEEPDLSCLKCRATFDSQETLVNHLQNHCYMQPGPGALRGMPRFRPAAQRNLLENFGFECVMQFNESHQRRRRDDKNNNENNDSKVKKETPTETTEQQHNVSEPVPDKPEPKPEGSSSQTNVKGKADVPEMNKCPCKVCGKEFSSIWVLKAHEEDVHKQVVPIAVVEEFSGVYREDYDKRQQPSKHGNDNQASGNEAVVKSEIAVKMEAPPSVPTTPNPMQDDKFVQAMNMSNDIAVSQALMQLPMLMGMPLNMPLPSMNMLPPFMPMMMHMPPELYGMPGLPMVDPSMMMAQQQQQAAALAAAQQQQKRARTRINDEQLKILRAHFDINNSPNEEQIQQMSDKSGLPPKVIKHWFRNTLFKERQRNKDSPYNFNIPPSTELNLEEYEKTGRVSANETAIDDVKAPRDMKNLAPSMLPAKLGLQVVKEEPVDNQDKESIASMSDSLVSSSPSTPVPIPPQPMHLPTAMAPGMSYSELSAALSNLQSPIASSAPPHIPLSLPATPTSSVNNPRNSTPKSTGSHHIPGKRANRTRFTDFQIKTLQEYFERNAYPKDDDLENLSKVLNLSPRVIVVWFQNARQKARKNYENQPAVDMSPEEGSRFNRTPGLNYQCKKCFTVFQRYYELIKHQRTHCYKDDERSIGATSEHSYKTYDSQDENSSSNDNVHSNASDMGKDNKQPTDRPASVGQYKCEKCNMPFHRLEQWKEHQAVHSDDATSDSSNFPSSSAFGMLQNIAQQQREQYKKPEPQEFMPNVKQENEYSMSYSYEEDSLKRRLYDDEEDDRDDQPRDKRMRTTILPEQLDYLYQKYQLDCNPSRKQLETIAAEVSLKKRVVQVWFQNTRARERKGQYRAHQQIIHKRCPFCRALFRAKSALESHLATKHAEEMAKGEVKIEDIPDEAESNTGTSPSPAAPALDMAKLLNNPYNVPNPFMPLPPASVASSSSDPVHSNMKRLYEDNLKKYINELSHASHQPKLPSYQTSGSQGHKSPASVSSSFKCDDAPLDLSKPLTSEKASTEHSFSSKSHHDDSISETHSESTNDEQSMPEGSSPSSPTGSNHRRGLQAKRYRTQMSSLQIRVMKNVFTDYKTPTMAECEMLGKEIGLQKRVVQVWFQNARAKEKKSKLSMGSSFGGPDVDFTRPPDKCNLCSFQYSHKYTIQDHVFTKRHIERVKAHIREKGHDDDGNTSGGSHQDGSGKSNWNLSGSSSTSDPPVGSHSHLAQLHAMGLQAINPSQDSKRGPGGNEQRHRSCPKTKSESSDFSGSEPSKSNSVVSSVMTPTSVAAQMMNPFGLNFPLPPLPSEIGASSMLPFMYPSTATAGLGGFFPGMGMPMFPPGLMPGPDSMRMYDVNTFCTPLNMLQIPKAAISAIETQVRDGGVSLTHYTQDCSSLSQVHANLSPADAQMTQETMLDVGFICSKCHLVFPGRDGCLSHQQSSCYPGKSAAELHKCMVKLEQVQYECLACGAKCSTRDEYTTHCSDDTHRRKTQISTSSASTRESVPSSAQTMVS